MSLLDLILRCDESSLIDLLWTEDLLAELSRKWVEKGVRSVDEANRICQQIRVAFAGQDVPRAEYESLIDQMPGGDIDDHVHAAAAVSRAPVTILTNNVRDFPGVPLGELGVTASTPDDFLLDLHVSHSADLVDVIVQMAAARRNPSMSTSDVLDALSRAGVPKFAAKIRADSH